MHVGQPRVSVLSPSDSGKEGPGKLASHEAYMWNGKEALLPLKNWQVHISQAKQLLSSFFRIFFYTFLIKIGIYSSGVDICRINE